VSDNAGPAARIGSIARQISAPPAFADRQVIATFGPHQWIGVDTAISAIFGHAACAHSSKQGPRFQIARAPNTNALGYAALPQYDLRREGGCRISA